MSLVFVLIVVVGASAAYFLSATKYTASTRLLVTLGQEYVFDPIGGEAGRGAFVQPEEMMQAEAELARSPVIAERVITNFGLAKLYPRLAQVHGPKSEQQAIEAFGKDFAAYSGPKSSILRLSYTHKDPTLAAAVVNETVKIYVEYRREVLASRGFEGLGKQRTAIEDRLKVADDALRSFLSEKKISDFGAEKDAATRLFGSLSDELSKVEASLREAEGRAQGLRRQLNSTKKEIDLYTETTSEQQLYDLKTQRQQMLGRYRADSQAVKDIDRKIAQMESLLQEGKPGGLRRIGPNPTWQALEADQADAEAEADAMAGRAQELARQKGEASARLRELSIVEPDYQRLVRDRDALAASAMSFATREQAERARSELAAQRADNISVYEPARAPARGSSPQSAIIAGAALFGLMTALMIGVMQAWRARGFATTGSLARTTGIRSLGAIGDRSR